MFAHFLDFLNVMLYFKINGYVYVDHIISLFLVLTSIPPPAKKRSIRCFLEIYCLVWSLDLANQIGLLLSPFSFLAQQVPRPTQTRLSARLYRRSQGLSVLQTKYWHNVLSVHI